MAQNTRRAKQNLDNYRQSCLKAWLFFFFFFRSSECCGCAQIATAGRKFSVGKVEKPRLPWERSLVYLPARVLRLGGDCVRSTNARIIADGVTGEKCGTAAWCSALSPTGERHLRGCASAHMAVARRCRWDAPRPTRIAAAVGSFASEKKPGPGLSPKFWSKLSASPFAHRHLKRHSLICIVCIKSRAICSHFFILLSTTVLLRLGCREGVPCSETDEEPKDKKPRQQTGRDLAEQAVQRARDSPSVGRGR